MTWRDGPVGGRSRQAPSGSPKKKPAKAGHQGVGVNGKGKWRLFHPIYLLLVIPYVGLLWTPFFNRVSPEFFGIPFFYWYQILWTPVTSLLIVPVYLHQKRRK
ncbi:MAG: hypothetical protein JWM33_3202 [Caulobacteraceae bacterium]|nr:hypothetical protein [Caulobacteraceae bacterium]